MEKVFRVFEQIKNEPSKNEKIKIIQENKDCTSILEVLQFLLDSSVVTGISKAKINKKLKQEDVCDYDGFMGYGGFRSIIHYLKKNNTGKDSDVAYVQSYINKQDESIQQFLKDIVTKSYKLGADYKTVNKALGYELIKTWEVQQAYPISDKNRPKDGDWFALTPKLNGNNVGYYQGKLISRQGKEFKGLDHIIQEIKSIYRENDIFLNGELIRKNVDGVSDSENFRIGTGIINSDKETKEEISMIIYEVLTGAEFEFGTSHLTYRQRREGILDHLSNEIKQNNFEHISVVPVWYSGTDQTKIDEWLDYADSNDYEGVMLNKDTKWQNKRNNGILKVKSFNDIELRCISVNIADSGKYEGMLGSITCKYNKNTVDVGSGFTDEQRIFYAKNPKEIENSIVTVKYKEKTKNKSGGESLQFPIFISRRFDKSMADDEVN